jgi:hypothetical protein
MQELSFSEVATVGGGLNTDLIYAGFVTGALGAVAAVTMAPALVAVGGIAVIMGGAAMAAGLGDLSGNNSRIGSGTVNWNVGGENFTICKNDHQCTGSISSGSQMWVDGNGNLRSPGPFRRPLA